MEFVRRFSALLIALSLALPQRSCISGGQVEIHYPLSNTDSLLSVLVIAALYSLPLIVLVFFRFRKTALIVGTAAVAAGLYFISYAAFIVADRLLIGWYSYTLAAIVYLCASLMQFKRVLSAAVPPKGHSAADLPN